MGATLCSTESKPSLLDVVGKPTACVVPAGNCQFSEEPQKCKLLSKKMITHDTFVTTWELPTHDEFVGNPLPEKPLGLATCACVLALYFEQGTGELIVRPYTPVSTNEMIGKFQLVIKKYPGGKMSNYIDNLQIGERILFKHIEKNVKIQYPFAAKHITMLVGGTGITPMIQALHAILGTPEDTTKVNLIWGNKTQDDILGKELLDSWAASSNGRLTVTHVLSMAENDSSWTGEKGFITKELIEKQTPGPSENPLIFVCGPPPMYDALSGPRLEAPITGILGGLGYTDAHVVKF